MKRHIEGARWKAATDCGAWVGLWTWGGGGNGPDGGGGEGGNDSLEQQNMVSWLLNK